MGLFQPNLRHRLVAKMEDKLKYCDITEEILCNLICCNDILNKQQRKPTEQETQLSVEFAHNRNLSGDPPRKDQVAQPSSINHKGRDGRKKK